MLTITQELTVTLTAKRLKELDRLCEKLGVAFGRLGLLNEALTHSSYASEHPGVRDYERLEFFGDAVLKFVISEYLLERFPEYDEGELSEIRAAVVSDKSLAEVANSLNVGKHILLGTRVQLRPSITARSMEAIIGAVYMDMGLIHVQNFIVRLFGSRTTTVDRDDVKDNYKAALQELSQARGHGVPNYTVIDTAGPPHQQVFTISCSVNGEILSSGTGTSKKAAEQEAARIAFAELTQRQDEAPPRRGGDKS